MKTKLCWRQSRKQNSIASGSGAAVKFLAAAPPDKK